MKNTVPFAIGSYTEKQPHVPGACGEGIVLAEFNEETGNIEIKNTIGGMKNPSYLDWDSTNQFLYVITESPDGEGEIQSFSIKSSDTYVLNSHRGGPGRAGCHLNSNKKGDQIFASSYVDGSLKGYPVAGGKIGKPFINYSYKGSGPNLERQLSPHAHQVLFSPDNRYLYVCDLGSDRIWKHGLESKDPDCESALELPGGYGPRHLAFDPQGKYVYILCELKPRLIVAEINGKNGSMTIIQDLPAAGDSSCDIIAPAAVKVHPSGNTIAISNRFDDRITVFKINRSSAHRGIPLEYLSGFSSKGKTPRDITFSPSGRWLLIANQDSSDIQVKAFDSRTGCPEDHWAAGMNTGTPVCLVFISCTIGCLYRF